MAIRRSPFDVFDEMDRMLDQLRRSMYGAGPDPALGGHDLEMDGPTGMNGRMDSNVSVDTDDEAVFVVADLPGFERDEIGLRYDETAGQLTITADHAVSDEYSSRRRRISERIVIPGDVLVEHIEASYHNGVLEVQLPLVTDDGDAITGHRIDID